jgi:hypothetical protein
MSPAHWPRELFESLKGGTISVFEDTTAGVMAVQSAALILAKAGIDVRIREYGTAKEKSKKAYIKEFPLSAR